MNERVAAGAWVQIRATVLRPEERAEQAPDETRAVALELTAKGRLERVAAIGEEVTITTPAGRTLRGTLVAVDSPYVHGFGRPVPELIPIGRELRALLATRERQ